MHSWTKKQNTLIKTHPPCPLMLNTLIPCPKTIYLKFSSSHLRPPLKTTWWNHRFRGGILTICPHTPEGGVNSITGATLSVWTDTNCGLFDALRGKHPQHPGAITVPAKHSATVILVLAGELILFVMRCLVCRVGSGLDTAGQNILWLDTWLVIFSQLKQHHTHSTAHPLCMLCK